MACKIIVATFLALAVAVSAAPAGQRDATVLSPPGAATPPICVWNADKGQYVCPDSPNSPPICTWNPDKGQYTCPDSALKPNETSVGVSSHTLARRYASGICGFHVTLELSCEQDLSIGPDWHQITYATIKSVTDGNRKPFITTDGNPHRLVQDSESPWHVSGDGFKLYAARIDVFKNEAIKFRAYHGGPGEFAHECAFNSNKPIKDGECGNCYVGDFTHPPIDCGNMQRPAKRVRDMDCFTFC
ncbi:hypothetical protein BCR34DRAFT_200294 [Clohesyomyces aquaticus]|uniref:Uncharacterized protein n=1 Tax=Clohesyomyces aquaticus TaxID=1231657 RepID=A0A1Y1YBD0_9PLEO|nr:hypothetical protein BCR34DRAFT_200294 [Clohesyomyces aquaticus]